MPTPVKSQVPTPKAVEVYQRFEPTDKPRKLVEGDLPADVHFARLIEQGLYLDALEFLAYWLPKREAIWWGCLCVWKVVRLEPAEKEAAALKAAVSWVLEPGEANRRAAEAAGKAAGIETLEGCLAKAVFYSGGSLTPPNVPEVAPKPHLTAKILLVALRAAAFRIHPEDQARAHRLFLRLGDEVVSGSNRWESA